MTNESINELIARLEDSDGRVEALLHDAVVALRWQQQQIQILSNQIFKEETRSAAADIHAVS